MSVIKSAVSRSAQVRAFGLSAPDPEPSPLVLELERLRSDLAAGEAREAALRAELAGRDQAETLACDAARAEGKAEGEALADARHAERLTRLSEAVEAAQAVFADKLALIERLAAGFAGEALARITGDPERHAELLTATIARELKGMATDAIVAVEVSASDFPDADGLTALARTTPVPAVVEAVRSLPSGGCRIRLKLGEIDLSLHSQSARLRQILHSHADGRL